MLCYETFRFNPVNEENVHSTELKKKNTNQSFIYRLRHYYHYGYHHYLLLHTLS